MAAAGSAGWNGASAASRPAWTHRCPRRQASRHGSAAARCSMPATTRSRSWPKRREPARRRSPRDCTSPRNWSHRPAPRPSRRWATSRRFDQAVAVSSWWPALTTMPIPASSCPTRHRMQRTSHAPSGASGKTDPRPAGRRHAGGGGKAQIRTVADRAAPGLAERGRNRRAKPLHKDGGHGDREQKWVSR
ncbi:hypothetical protein ACVWW3_000641 [Bradyrhizobium sp. LM2.9]